MSSRDALSRVRISIMCHPSRERMAARLRHELGGDTNCRFVPADPSISSTLDTVGRALGPDGESSDFEVVLCEDVTLSTDFLRRIESLLPHVTTDSIVALFAPAHGESASLARVLWSVHGPGLFPIVDAYAPCTGFVMARETASEASRYLRAQFDLGSWRPDDRILHEYSVKAGLRKLVAVPNLVDHDRFGSASLLGHDLPGLRRSMLFVDDCADLPDARWSDAAGATDSEVWAPHLYWDGLQEGYLRWASGTGARICGEADLLHSGVLPRLDTEPDALASARLGGFRCADCLPRLRWLAVWLGLAQRTITEQVPGRHAQVPDALVATAMLGAVRKYHSNQDAESGFEAFAALVDHARDGRFDVSLSAK